MQHFCVKKVSQIGIRFVFYLESQDDLLVSTLLAGSRKSRDTSSNGSIGSEVRGREAVLGPGLLMLPDTSRAWLLIYTLKPANQ